MIRRSLELYPHSLVEYIAIVQPDSVQIREMWQRRSDTTKYPPA